MGCHLLLLGPYNFSSYCAHFCIKWSLDISDFLEEISSFSHCIVFPQFLCLLQKAFLTLLDILWNSAVNWVYLSLSPLPLPSLPFLAICKASLDNHLAFLHFFFLGMVLITTSYTVSQTSVHCSSYKKAYKHFSR